jgi:hypothetical protein
LPRRLASNLSCIGSWSSVERSNTQLPPMGKFLQA